MTTWPIVLSGRILDGSLKLTGKRRLERILAHSKPGPIVVTIERAHATRSREQNAYIWGVCYQLVSEHTGYTVDEVHEFAKQMFLPKKLALCDGNGEVKGEVVIGGTTTRLNKLEFTEFIESFRRWSAMELGVVIPDPDPDWREKVSA